MTQFANLLREQASVLRSSDPAEIAVGHLKEAGLSEQDARAKVAQHYMEKEAAEYISMTSSIDIEHALNLVKTAGINVADLSSFDFAPEENIQADLLEKAAAYIETLEAELKGTIRTATTLEKVAKAKEVEAKIEATPLPEQFTKAASANMFTAEDLKALKQMDQELLTKVAATMDNAPWELGRGQGPAIDKMDPMLQFLMS